MFLSCILTLQPGAICERSSWCWLSLWVWVWTFSSTAQEYTHHRCCMDIWSLNTAQHPQEQNWTQICSTEHLSIYQSTQPAHLSRLIRPELHFYPFEHLIFIWIHLRSTPNSSYLQSGYDRMFTQFVRQQGNIHSYQPEPELNNSVLFACTPSKWLTDFLWREISLAGTTARLHSLYQQRGKRTQHKHSGLD